MNESLILITGPHSHTRARIPYHRIIIICAILVKHLSSESPMKREHVCGEVSIWFQIGSTRITEALAAAACSTGSLNKLAQTLAHERLITLQWHRQ